jgi:hypothetical protein
MNEGMWAVRLGSDYAETDDGQVVSQGVAISIAWFATKEEAEAWKSQLSNLLGTSVPVDISLFVGKWNTDTEAWAETLK